MSTEEEVYILLTEEQYERILDFCDELESVDLS